MCEEDSNSLRAHAASMVLVATVMALVLYQILKRLIKYLSRVLFAEK